MVAALKEPSRSKRRRELLARPEWKPRFREAMAPRPRITVSQWAEKYRILGDESPKPGDWKNWRTPYLVNPMDAVSDPAVETIICCFAAQVGKTEFENNTLGWIVTEEPGTTLVAFPDERAADKHVRLRLWPMVLNSPEVRKRLLNGKESLGLKEMHFDRCSVVTAWSNSPSSMSSTPCRYVLIDEADAFGLYAGGRHGNPIDQLGVRTRAYKGRNKILIVSTPTIETAYVWPLWLQSNQHLYNVACPLCGEYQALEFTQLKWEKKVAPLEIYVRNLAWFECVGCKDQILPSMKREMVLKGKWVPKGMRLDKRGHLEGDLPQRIRTGFRLPVFYSPMVTWGEAAKEWLESLGDQGRIHNFNNLWLALPYEQKRQPVTLSKIEKAKRKYKPGTVPAGAMKLTAGFDVQIDHFWFSVRAWGLHEHSWLVRYGILHSWHEVDQVLKTLYPSEDGNRTLGIERACMDCRYRMREVYDFVRSRFPRLIATVGSGHPGMVQSKYLSHPEPGIARYTFKADLWKDKLASLIDGKGGDESEWMVFDGVDEDYVKQMTGEEKKLELKAGRGTYTWKPRTETTPVHLWDTEVLNTLAADLAGVPYLALQTSAMMQETSTETSGRGGGEAWFGGGDRDGKWLGGEKEWFGG